MSQTLKAAKGQKDMIKNSKETTLSSSYFTNTKSSWHALSREILSWMGKQGPPKQVYSLKGQEIKEAEIHVIQETNKENDTSDWK